MKELQEYSLLLKNFLLVFCSGQDGVCSGEGTEGYFLLLENSLLSIQRIYVFGSGWSEGAAGVLLATGELPALHTVNICV